METFFRSSWESTFQVFRTNLFLVEVLRKVYLFIYLFIMGVKPEWNQFPNGGKRARVLNTAVYTNIQYIWILKQLANLKNKWDHGGDDLLPLTTVLLSVLFHILTISPTAFNSQRDCHYSLLPSLPLPHAFSLLLYDE